MPSRHCLHRNRSVLCATDVGQCRNSKLTKVQRVSVCGMLSCKWLCHPPKVIKEYVKSPGSWGWGGRGRARRNQRKKQRVNVIKIHSTKFSTSSKIIKNSFQLGGVQKRGWREEMEGKLCDFYFKNIRIMHIHTCIQTHIQICIHTYVKTHTYIHVNTHTHIREIWAMWDWPATHPGASEGVTLPKLDLGPLLYRSARLNSLWKPQDLSTGLFQNTQGDEERALCCSLTPSIRQAVSLRPQTQRTRGGVIYLEEGLRDEVTGRELTQKGRGTSPVSPCHYGCVSPSPPHLHSYH